LVQWSGQTTGFLLIKLVFFIDKYILKNYCRTIIIKILKINDIFSVFQSCKSRMHIYFSLVLISNQQFVNWNDYLYFLYYCVVISVHWILIDGVENKNIEIKEKKRKFFFRKLNWINAIPAFYSSSSADVYILVRKTGRILVAVLLNCIFFKC